MLLSYYTNENYEQVILEKKKNKNFDYIQVFEIMCKTLILFFMIEFGLDEDMIIGPNTTINNVFISYYFKYIISTYVTILISECLLHYAKNEFEIHIIIECYKALIDVVIKVNFVALIIKHIFDLTHTQTGFLFLFYVLFTEF